MIDEKQIQDIEERFEQVKSQLSEMRKKGKDTKISELLIMNVNSKIAMLKVTHAEKDYNKLVSIFEKISSENKIVDEAGTMEHIFSSSLDKVSNLVVRAQEQLKAKDRGAAVHTYNEIRTLFRILDKAEKESINKECIALYKQIKDVV